MEAPETVGDNSTPRRGRIANAPNRAAMIHVQRITPGAHAVARTHPHVEALAPGNDQAHLRADPDHSERGAASD
jgi:hypothetical protein